MKHLVFFIAFKVLVFANAYESQIQKALDLLAEDGGSRGSDINQFIQNQIASGKLVIKSESLKATKGRDSVGTVRSKNGKLVIVVDTSQSVEKVALTIAHEYMHLSTATYLDRMETSHPDLFKSIQRGSLLVDKLDQKKKLSREEQRDVFTYVMFHLLDEANAYMYEHKLAGKTIKPPKRTDIELSQLIWEQQQSYKWPSLPLDLSLKAIHVIRTDMPPAETMNVLATTENFESYLRANPNLSSDATLTNSQKPSTTKGSR